MKNSILAAFFVIALCGACSNEKETSSGQKFTIIKKGDGKEITEKHFMVMDFIFKDAKDSVWYDTRKNPYPQIMQKQPKPVGGDRLMDVIYMLTKGDSVTLKMSAIDLFTKSFRQPVPPKVDSLSYFTFVINMKDALDSAQFGKFRTDLVAKQNEIALKEQSAQLAKDTVAIDSYLKEKNIKASKTSTGLRYVITKPGKGDNAKDGQTASVSYAGYLLSGKCFDTSIEAVARENNMYQADGRYAPYPVTVGKTSVIEGWHQALRLMNKGCKMTVYIPSALAYGSRSRGQDIAPNSILMFDMEVAEIK